MKRLRPVFSIFVICMTIYLGNCRTVALLKGGDTIPNRLIPYAILGYGEVTLDEFRDDFVDGGAGVRPWYTQEARGSLVSFYPIGTSLAAVPFYVPFYCSLWLLGRPTAHQLFIASQRTEKLVASTITALAVVAFYLTIRRRVSSRQAFWAALAMGVGTLMWATCSQMLWQQTAVAACVAVALWLLTWPEQPPWTVACAGAALGLAVAARPSSGFFFLSGLAVVLTLSKGSGRWLRLAILYIAGAFPLLFLGLGTNWYYYGHLSGIYAQFLTGLANDVFSLSRIDGVAGLLISPNRGLFIFTPIALFGVWGILRQLRKPRDPVLVWFGPLFFVYLFMFGSFLDWRGGWSFGPRYLVDVIPILAYAAVDVWNRAPRWLRHIGAVLILWGVLVQADGAFCYPASNWNGRHESTWETSVWSWKDFQLWEDFRAWRRAHVWVTRY